MVQKRKKEITKKLPFCKNCPFDLQEWNQKKVSPKIEDSRNDIKTVCPGILANLVSYKKTKRVK